jgi:signal transduction histidine kinase/putative methionine-R-sulfoxide reductase with GAF domain
LHTQLGYDHVSLFLVDGRDEQYLVQHAHRSAWERPDEIGYRQRIGHGLLGTAAQERRPMLVQDVANDGRYVPIPGAPPHMAELAVPIVLHHRVLGVLDVAGKGQLDDEDVTAISIIAGQLAVTIDNARRYAEEQQRVARLQLIARVGQRIAARLQPAALFTTTVAELHHQLGYDHAAIFLLDQDDPRWLIKRATVSRWPGNPPGYRQHIDRGLMGAAARQRHAVLVNDVRTDERHVPIPGGDALYAELATPIVLGDRLLGVLDVGSVGVLNTEDVTAIQIIADQLATAIDNARLFADTEHALRTTQLLYTTSQGFSTALDTDEVIAAYLGHVAAGSPYTCLVVLVDDDGSTSTMRGYWTPSGGVAITNTPLIIDPTVATALQAGQPILIDDAQPDRLVQLNGSLPAPGALAILPLIVRGQWIGAIVVCREQAHVWRTAELQAYQVTAAPLAVALDSRQQHMLLRERGQHVAVLEERQRLARDLHDSVTQQLFSITLIAQALAPAWQRDPTQGAQRVERLLRISQTALAEMRALLIELRPPTTTVIAPPTRAGPARVQHDGLVAALRAYVGEHQRDSLMITLHADEYVPQEIAAEIALYRIVQEAINNVRKHAAADHVVVRVWTDDEHVHLRVKDDGQGFIPESQAAPPTAGTSGFGLPGMRERAEALGGRCTITSAPNEGTAVDVWIRRNDRS